MKKVNHDYKCQECGKVATKSIGDMWHSYDITEDGDFSENDSWGGKENEFYCDECYDKKD